MLAKHGQPCQQFCPAYKKKCNKCDTIGYFARTCRKGFLNKERQQQSHQVQDDSEEDLFIIESKEVGNSENKREGKR